VAGKLKDLASFSSKGLRARMDYFLDKVKKRIYLTGPKSALVLEKVLSDECKFKGNEKDIVATSSSIKRQNKGEFIFVPVKDANQVQLRIGRFLNNGETLERNLDALATEFLGGGFTSRLMREVRVKRGLTYSIGSFISAQKQYGRAGISTFTKNETIDKLINVIDETLAQIKKEGITDTDLSQATEGMVGAYPFKFESNTAFLGQLMLLDHIGKPYSDLFGFKESVQKYTALDVVRKINEVYDINQQIIFVLGDKSIEPKLRALEGKYGKLKILNYGTFL
jgi:zinc protease